MFLFIDCGFMSYKTHVHLLNQHNSLLYWAVGGRYRQIFTERRRWDYSSEVNCVKAVSVWSPRRAPLPSNNGASAQTPTPWFREHFCQDQAHTHFREVRKQVMQGLYSNLLNSKNSGVSESTEITRYPQWSEVLFMSTHPSWRLRPIPSIPNTLVA